MSHSRTFREKLLSILNYHTRSCDKATFSLNDFEDIPADRRFQILANCLHHIVSNSVKYHSPDRDLHIEATVITTKEKITVAISDNGIGIPQSIASGGALGQRGYRVNKLSGIPGNGLGLFTVRLWMKGLCKGFKWQGTPVQIDSALGEGTTVTLTLGLIPNDPPTLTSLQNEVDRLKHLLFRGH